MISTNNSQKYFNITTIIYFCLTISIYSQNQWEEIPSSDIGQLSALSYHNNTIFVGTSKGLFSYSEENNSILPLSEDIFSGKTIHTLESINNKLYAFTNNGIYLFENQWQNIWPDLSNYSHEMESILEFGDTILVGARRRVYYSTNSGNSWSYLGDSAKTFEYSSIWSLFKNKNGFIYAGTSCGLFRLNKERTEWSELENFNCGDILSFAENSKGDLYIGGADRFKGIHKSSNNGETWRQIYEPLDSTRSLATNSIIIDSNDQIIFSTFNNYGIFISEKNDSSFQSINSGLTDLNIWNLAETKDGTIFAQANSTLYKSINPLSDLEDELLLNKKIVLSQNYPNPFNPTTLIKFTLPSSSIVQVKVFDILGKEIEVLLNSYKQSGNYEIEFHASDLPSGIYMYRIVSGGYSLTKKMILLK